MQTIQDRANSVPNRIRFVAFHEVRIGEECWIYEGYGATADEAKEDLGRRMADEC